MEEMNTFNGHHSDHQRPTTSFCVLCCYSYVPQVPKEKPKPGPKSRRNGVHTRFTEFCEKIASKKEGAQLESLFTILEPVYSASSLASRKISVCPECMGLIQKAMEVKGRVDSLEGHVRTLQLQILEQLRELEEIVTIYHDEMQKIESVVDSADVSCLEFQVHQLRKEKRNYGEDEEYPEEAEDDVEELGRQVFLFREGVMEVAADKMCIRNVQPIIPTENIDYYSEPVVESFPNVEVQLDENDVELNTVDDYYYDPGNYSIPVTYEDPVPSPPPVKRTSKPRQIICKKTSTGGRRKDPLEVIPDEPTPSSTRKIIIIKKVSPNNINVPKAIQGNKKVNFRELIVGENEKRTRSHVCKICYKTFGSAESLMAHAYTHGEDFRCSNCRKGFPTWQELDEHEATHRKYECTFCEKVFKNSGNLKAHERIHTGERPYKCASCPKDFIQLGGLQYHLKTNPSHKGVF